MPIRRALRASILSFVLLLPAAAHAAPNFTFFFTADTHYGLDQWTDNEVRNKATIARMNNLPGTALPASLGGVVDTPKGVLIGRRVLYRESELKRWEREQEALQADGAA